MTYVGTELLEVWAWGRLVGACALDPSKGAYAFEYAPGWLDEGVELAPIHLPRAPGVFAFPSLDAATYHRLPPLLADALPDRFGNAVVDAWMARRGVAARVITPLDRLAYTADRAMGALEFRPPLAPEAPPPTVVELADLVDTARRSLTGELTDGAEAEASLERLVQVGTSAGGARAKAVIAYDPVTSRIRSGQHEAPDGFEHWLIKLDGVDVDPSREAALGPGRGYASIELGYHRMALDAGVDMSECRLLPEGPRTHFLTRRFDRVGTSGKLHLLSLCGLAHLDFNHAGAHGYEQYLSTVGELGLGPDARAQAFRRAVFNVAAVNRDDHTKNLAFLCDPDGTWRLAPAYDLTFAYNPAGAWTARHQMSIGGKTEGIALADLEELGDRFAVPAHRSVIADVLAAVDRWPAHAEEAGVAGDVAARIGEVHRRFRPR